MRDETRPAPEWAGDVHAGVDAWVRGRAQPDQGPVDEPAALSARPARSGRSGWSGRSGQSGRSGEQGRGRRTQGERSGRRERRPPPPVDHAAQGPEADPESVARTILLDQLTGRARSRKELSDKLASKDVPPDVATRLLDRFEGLGLVDDEAFARTWVAQRGAGGTTSRALATRALAQELRRKGVADDVAGAVLEEVDPADEEQAARVLVRKKLRSLSRVDDVTATRRLVGMLARKGYPSGLSFGVVREELAAADRDGPGDDGLESGDDGL